MKIKSFVALLLVLVMCLAFVACTDAGKDKETTKAVADTTVKPVENTTAKPASTTKTPADTTVKVTEAQTTVDPASITTAEPVGTLTELEAERLKLLMPTTLPDNSEYTTGRFMCMDDDSGYYLATGNSSGSSKYVDEASGAIFGKAFSFAGKADSKDSRGEVQVMPLYSFSPVGARGIMFYVDFSALTVKADAVQCASVTMNVNDVRSQGPDKVAGSAVAYYYENGTWVQTSNITSCRMQIPTSFKGWIYVPATSYTQTADGMYWSAETGKFVDFEVTNMRFYTDGYTYSADTFIIFDEITFIY